MPSITDRDQLPEEHRHHFDSIAESRGGVRGPFRLLLNSPVVAGRAGHLGAYIRYESHLAGDERELAILTAAREFNCAYEWAAHVPIAEDEGTRDAAIDAVASRGSLSELTDTEAAIIQYGRELFQEYRVSDDTYAAAAAIFDDQQIIELTATMGYYGLIACILNAFEVTPDEDAPQLPR